MVVYSWNVLFRNKRLTEALAFVRSTDADVFCLQEVPQELLEKLKESFPHVAAATDVERLYGAAALPAYNVIISRYPLRAQGVIELPDYQMMLPLRTRITRALLRPFHFTRIRNRNGLFADLATPEGLVRIFNLHLILANPAWRAGEFERAMAQRDPSVPTIVCGDFNIVESPKVSLLNWLFGGTVSDAVRYRRERMSIEQHFAAHELVNPLVGLVTHPLSRSQLDHILTSRTLSIVRAEVIAERHGSDHRPVKAEVQLA